MTATIALPRQPHSDRLARLRTISIVMPWFYGLLNSPQVAALASVAAYPAAMPEGGYPGVMTAAGNVGIYGKRGAVALPGGVRIEAVR